MEFQSNAAFVSSSVSAPAAFTQPFTTSCRQSVGHMSKLHLSKKCTRAVVRMDAGEAVAPAATEPSSTSSLQSQKSKLEISTAAQALPRFFGSRRLRLYGGSSAPELTQQIATYLGLEEPNQAVKKQFSDGELYVKLESSVRGTDVFIVQSTCSPVNDNLMELMLFIDACRRAHAAQVTVVIPYYGYARADRIVEKREALSSKLVANLLVKAGTDRVIVMDIHSPQSCGFYDIPVDHIHGSVPLIQYLKREEAQHLDNMIIVSPDVGGVARARHFAKMLNDAPLAIIDKRRSAHNVAEVMNLIGDVNGKVAVLVDDMIDTAGTIVAGAKLLREKGAKAVYAMATHAILSGPAVERLSEPGVLEQVIVTNTIPIPKEKKFEQLREVSVAHVLGEAIWKAHEDFSISGSWVL